MADNNRYGGSTYGDERNDDYRGRDQSQSYGSGGHEDRGYGAFNQGGGYGQSGYGRQVSSSGDNDREYVASRQSDYHYGRRDNDRFDNRDENRRIAIDETNRLIASDKVEGTAVYDRRGNRLGTIENFMVEKRSGRVEYAVLSFGGFLGMGQRHYPLPWNQLTYDERYGGYVVDITERDLEQAPSHRAGDNASYDRAYSSNINSYYGSRRY